MAVKIIHASGANSGVLASIEWLNFDDFLEVSFRQKPLLGQVPIADFTLKKKVKLLDFLDLTSSYLVSEKFKKILLTFDPRVEFLPARVFVKDELSDENFYLFNPVYEVECIDFEKSIVEKDKNNKVKKINKLFLDIKKIGDEAVFKVGQTYYQLICFQEKLVAELKKNKCSGIAFCTPPEWAMEYGDKL